MSGFELQISYIRNNRFTNLATTTAKIKPNLQKLVLLVNITAKVSLTISSFHLSFSLRREHSP